MANKLSRQDMLKKSVGVFVDGIPAIAFINTYNKVKPNRFADNPYDYHGYVETEFTLYDRTGYRAHWLAKIMDRKGLEDDIRDQILEIKAGEEDYED